MSRLKKMFLISFLILLILYVIFSPLIFFWGYYIEVLALSIISIILVIISILGLTRYILSMVRDKSSDYLASYRSEHKKKKRVGLIIVLISCIFTLAFFGWLFSLTYKDAILLSKDIPNVLNKRYVKVECYVLLSKTSSVKGDHYSQTITIRNKLDDTVSIIRFKHDYKKIESYSDYTILYLPNSKLGVRAEKEK